LICDENSESRNTLSTHLWSIRNFIDQDEGSCGHEHGNYDHEHGNYDHDHGDYDHAHGDHEHSDHEHYGSHTHAHTHTNQKAVLNRISRIMGHLNGVRAMIEEGRDCAEVLIQLAAVRSALSSTCKVIFEDHMNHCVVDAIETGDTETLKDLNRAIALLLK